MGIKEQLTNQRNYLQKILEKCSRRIECAPVGAVRVSVSGNNVRYYHLGVNDNPSGKYISTKNQELIKALIQKDYEKKVCKYVQEQLRAIDRILLEYNDASIDDLLKKEHIERQKFITPVEVPWERYVEQWLAEPQEGHFIDNYQYIITTDRGEKVRSKSEKIIADYLYHNNIPYKYEKSLQLNSKRFFPDFTILSSKTKDVKYWEHFGMMDNSDYVKKTLDKIQVYQENGIFAGEQLIVTYEMKDMIISRETVVRLVERYL